jgi:flagellar basal body P-ring formation protein FlgA
MMFARSIFVTALLAAAPMAALAQEKEDAIAGPVLRAQVMVESDVVLIGDVIENAGTAARIAIYRAPDLGTTGTLPTAQIINVLQAHQVIGVNTRDIKSVSVTRLARTLEGKEIESQVAHVLEHRSGLGDAANLSLTFDHDVQDVRLEASNNGSLQLVTMRFEPRSGRFDVTFEIASDVSSARTRLRFTGIAVETIEAAILTRSVERNDVLKASDVTSERRPKAEVGGEAATRSQAVGMRMRKQLRAGQALRAVDITKPDLVQRDDNVTLIYETAGLYLTVRGKALESGTEGDNIGVLNLQSKRAVTGVVVGRDQVAITVIAPRLDAAAETTSSIDAAETATPVSVASRNSAQTNSKAE